MSICGSASDLCAIRPTSVLSPVILFTYGAGRCRPARAPCLHDDGPTRALCAATHRTTLLGTVSPVCFGSCAVAGFITVTRHVLLRLVDVRTPDSGAVPFADPQCLQSSPLRFPIDPPPFPALATTHQKLNMLAGPVNPVLVSTQPTIILDISRAPASLFGYFRQNCVCDVPSYVPVSDSCQYASKLSLRRSHASDECDVVLGSG